MITIKGRILLLGAVSIGLAAGGPAAAQAPPAIPPEVAPFVPRNLRSYFVAFLVNPPEPRPMSHELFVRHQAYLRRQLEAGVYRLVGPFTDGGHVRGIAVLSAESAEQARTIAAGDPAVQEGVLAVEIHPAVLPDLSGLRIEYPENQ